MPTCAASIVFRNMRLLLGHRRRAAEPARTGAIAVQLLDHSFPDPYGHQCPISLVSAYSRFPGRQRLSSSEFETTDTELIAIAAPATTGLSQPSAASGIPNTL
jgi:hypothetical protein